MKIKSTLISILLIAFVILSSCEDNNDDFPAIETDSSESMVADYNTNQVQCKVTIDNLHPHVINNFAARISIAPDSNAGISSIYTGQSTSEYGFIHPLSPVVEYVKDEYSIKKIIASWDRDSTRALTDSLYLDINKIDSKFHEKLNYKNYSVEDSTIIYVNLLNINRYGSAQVNLTNSDINNYLVYHINTGDGAVSSINLTPLDFRNKYGDAFCSSLMLGTFNMIEGFIFGVYALPNSRNAALNEAVEMVKRYLSGESEWEKLVSTSTYLKYSIFIDGYSKSSKGYSGELSGNYGAIVNTADSLYHLGEFAHYSYGFQLYSDLYPNFDFIDAEFPY